jgi:integral membrane protein
MERAWQWYRIMSFITGTTLLLLCAELILHHTLSTHAFHHYGFAAFDRVIGIGHGVILYPIYLVSAGLFAIKARVHLGTIVLMLLAGFVPGLAFYMEHWVGVRYGMIKPREEVAK